MSLFFTQSFFGIALIPSAFATPAGTFLAAQTVANDTDGATNTQSNTLATPTPNVTETGATITVDSDIVVKADTPGTAGNSLTVTIAQSDVDLGASTNATIDVSKTGNDITVTVVHNSNAAADGSAPIDVSRASVVAALNMSASSSTQG